MITKSLITSSLTLIKYLEFRLKKYQDAGNIFKALLIDLEVSVFLKNSLYYSNTQSLFSQQHSCLHIPKRICLLSIWLYEKITYLQSKVSMSPSVSSHQSASLLLCVSECLHSLFCLHVPFYYLKENMRLWHLSSSHEDTFIKLLENLVVRQLVEKI